MSANDRAIREAAVRLLAERGWRSVTTTEAGLQAGLTHGAVYERFRNKEQLALTVWDEELESTLVESLRELWSAAAGDFSTFERSLAGFWNPSTALIAAVELLLAAEFDPALGPGVREPIARLLAGRIDDTSPETSVVDMTLAVVALGLVMTSNRPWVPKTDAAFPAAWLAAGIHGITLDIPGADVVPIYLLDPTIDSGDERIDRVMESTVAVVGERGYDNAYLRDIAIRAGMSTRAVTRTFQHKIDLMAATLRWQHRRGLAGLHDYLQRAGKEIGPGQAEASAWRWYLAPELAHARTMLIEANRLQTTERSCWDAMVPAEQDAIEGFADQHPKPDHASALSASHLEFAMGMGLLAVARLVPQAHALPFQVITVPMQKHHPWSGSTAD
jgi:AcrR family transcriptional regulator